MSQSRAWYNQAIELLRQRRMSEASAALDHALEVAPNDGIIWYSKAVVLQNVGKPAEAEAYRVWATRLEEAPGLDLLPSNAGVIVHAFGSLLDAENWPETLQIFTQQQHLLRAGLAEKTLELLVQQAEHSERLADEDFLSCLSRGQMLLEHLRNYGFERTLKALESYIRLMEKLPPVWLLIPPKNSR